MKSIKSFLDSLAVLSPLKAAKLPADFAKGDIHNLDNIKCIVFDVYGTLLISASGDIDKSSFSIDNVLQLFRECDIKMLIDQDECCEITLTRYREIIRKQQRQLYSIENRHPEINIIEVWRELLASLCNDKIVEVTDKCDLFCVAFIFEVLTNPVWPMPGAIELIDTLKQSNMLLGIVSNAQFYTPILMNYFFNRKLEGGEHVENFVEELCLYSYRERRSKPDAFLFRKLARRLQLYDITPDECLFVGNDMLKDVAAAAKCGFRTALFAGDARSLRLREDELRVKGIRPDIVLTRLNELKFRN